MAGEIKQILEIKGLVLKKADHFIFQDLDFSLSEGEHTSIFCPDLDLKNQFIKVLTLQKPFSSGSFYLDGLNVSSHNKEAKAKISVISSHDQFDDQLNMLEQLQIWAQLFNVSVDLESFFEEMGVDQYQGVLPSELSPEIRYKFSFIRALITKPKLVIIDAGLELVMKYDFPVGISIVQVQQRRTEAKWLLGSKGLTVHVE